MFKKNDPMLEAVKGAMAKGDAQRKAIASVNEQFGVTSRRALTLQQKAEYDIALKEALSGEKPVIVEEEEDLNESISKIWNKYHSNEDKNYHAHNRVLLAKHFGTDQEHADAKELFTQHMKQGSLPIGPLLDKVNKANDGHWKKLLQAKHNEDNAARTALKPKDGSRTAELESRVAKAQAIAKTVKMSAKKGNSYNTNTVFGQPERTSHSDGKKDVELKGSTEHALARVKKIVDKSKGEIKNIKKQGGLFEQLDEASKEKLQKYISKAHERQIRDTRAKKLVKRSHLKVVKENNDDVLNENLKDKILTEISQKVLGSYIKKASKDIVGKTHDAGENRTDAIFFANHKQVNRSFKRLAKANELDKKVDQRTNNIHKAVSKLTNDEPDGNKKELREATIEQVKEEIAENLYKKYESVCENEITLHAFLRDLSEEEITLLEGRAGLFGMGGLPRSVPDSNAVRPGVFGMGGFPRTGSPTPPSVTSAVPAPMPKPAPFQPRGAPSSGPGVPAPGRTLTGAATAAPAPMAPPVAPTASATAPTPAPADTLAPVAAKRKPMQPAHKNPVARTDAPRTPVRKPVGPKKSFGYGSGGSGRDDAGSITNRALGAVNEEVNPALTDMQPKQENMKRSLESLLRAKYGQ